LRLLDARRHQSGAFCRPTFHIAVSTFTHNTNKWNNPGVHIKCVFRLLIWGDCFKYLFLLVSSICFCSIICYMYSPANSPKRDASHHVRSALLIPADSVRISTVRYLVTTVTNHILSQEEINSRNIYCHSFQNILSYRLLPKDVKSKCTRV
jgi:hypothetical protein